MCRGPLLPLTLGTLWLPWSSFLSPPPAKGVAEMAHALSWKVHFFLGFGVTVAILPLSACVLTCHPGTGLCDTGSFMLLGCAPLSSQHVKGRPSLGRL